MNDKEILIYLHTLKGVGWKTINQLISNLESLSQLFSLNPLELTVKSGIDFSLAEKITAQMETKFTDIFLGTLAGWKANNIKIITYGDENYPERLKEIYQPPWVLFAIGNTDLLFQPNIAVVGTRNPSNYGKIAAEKIAKELSGYGFNIVSGMARGIDRIAHEGALRVNGNTVAVLGNGIDVIYPKEHDRLYRMIADQGLVISEYPPTVQPHPGYFPQRNRIISGISNGVLVVEASSKSGSLITAQYALEQSREVFAIPGPITSKQSLGTNSLIQQGAKLVQSISDILDEFSYLPVKPEKNHNEFKVKLNNIEEKVYNVIDGNPIHIDEIFERLKIDLPELYQTLLTLQLKEKIKQLPGGIYVRNV